MTKLRNTIMLVLLALCVVACLGITVACDNETQDNTVAYTVTVKTEESAGISGAKVSIKKGGAIFGAPKTTGADGKVEFKLASDEGYTVNVVPPDGYELPEGATLTFSADRTLVVTLAESFAYTVKLVTPDNQPYYAEGVTVGVCTLSGNCLEPKPLGTNGVARIPVKKNDYHVQILDLPVAAAYECDDKGYYTGKNFSADDTEMTITVYTVNEIGVGAEMTAAQKTEFANAHKDYTADAQKLTAYKYSGTLAAGESYYYAIAPNYSGTYLFFKDNTSSYLYQKTEFKLGNKGNSIFSELVMTANYKYYIHVSNTGNSEINYEFVVAYPAASLTQLSNTGTTSVVIYDASKAAVIEFSPEESAAYKATVQGEQIAAIKVTEKSSNAADTAFNSSDYKASEVSFKYTEDMKGESVYLAVGVKSDETVPVTLRVKLEKLNDLTNTTTQKQLTETLTKYADQSGTLTPIALTATENAKIVKDGNVYRYGTGGPVVVVSLTGVLDERSAVVGMGVTGNEVRGQLAYLEIVTNGRVAPYTFLTSSAADLADLTKGKTFEDYTVMLRGFTEYKAEANHQGGYTLNIPTTGLADNYYTKNVNKDGVYPLTDELKEYLVKVAKNYPAVITATDAPEAAWLFACYYYAV